MRLGVGITTLGLLGLIFVITAHEWSSGSHSDGPSADAASFSSLPQLVRPTLEQENIRRRLAEENRRGTTRFLSVVSVMTGEVLLCSRVRGKVTGSSKRLSSYQMASAEQAAESGPSHLVAPLSAFPLYAPEPEEDGTYGSSVEYIYWWDEQGAYHQHFMVGGQFVHVSTAPVPVKGVTICPEGQ